MPGTPPARYAYLGPEGTFTEQALRSLPAADHAELLPLPTVATALEAVRTEEVGAALVPLENSVEGSVSTTLDELAAGDPLMIVREVVLPVTFALMAPAGTALHDVRRVATHPHAHAQCRRWLAEVLPGAIAVPATSTAAAAASLGQGGAGHDAAIAAPIAARRYGLETLASGIGDNPEAVTRFVLVSRPASPPPPTGSDRTTLVAFIAEDHPGALLEILTEFTVRGVNLTRIESRPTGRRLGSYCFSIDCEGHAGDARVGEALMGLRRVCADVRFLGSYPRVDGQPPTVRPGTTEPEFREAAAWLSRVRAGGG